MRRIIGQIRYWLIRLWRRRRVVRIEGPLERINGHWMMRIPLDAGGTTLAETTGGVGTIKGDVIEIELPSRLVENLKLVEGQHLWIHNATGEFSFEWEPGSVPVGMERQ